MATRFTPRESDVEPICIWQNLQNLSDWRHRKLQDGHLNGAECSRLVTNLYLSNTERRPLRESSNKSHSSLAFDIFINPY